MEEKKLNINNFSNESMAAKKELEKELDGRMATMVKENGYTFESPEFESDDINKRIYAKWEIIAHAQGIHREEFKEVSSETVAKSFRGFLRAYKNFRKAKELPDSKANVFEVTTAMQDKLGRISREVKHMERNDPKEEWPNGLIEASSGLLSYMIMLLENYDVSIYEGMITELDKAVEQHGGKE